MKHPVGAWWWGNIVFDMRIVWLGILSEGSGVGPISEISLMPGLGGLA